MSELSNLTGIEKANIILALRVFHKNLEYAKNRFEKDYPNQEVVALLSEMSYLIDPFEKFFQKKLGIKSMEAKKLVNSNQKEIADFFQKHLHD